MTANERISIIALAVGFVFAITGMTMAFSGNDAGIWVLVTGVALFGVVKVVQNVVIVRRALRKNRAD